MPILRAHDQWAIADLYVWEDDPSMKRIAAAPLWFLVGWYLGSVVAFALGLGGFLAPIAALGLSAFVVIDPGQLIWARREQPLPAPSTPRTAAVDPSHS